MHNIITLGQDIHSRWDDHTFVFIAVDGHFIACYISSGLDPQAADFHCARLDILEQVDSDLLRIRFALTIYHASAIRDTPRHPGSLRVTKSLRGSLVRTLRTYLGTAYAGPASVESLETDDVSAVMDDVPAA